MADAFKFSFANSNSLVVNISCPELIDALVLWLPPLFIKSFCEGFANSLNMDNMLKRFSISKNVFEKSLQRIWLSPFRSIITVCYKR